MNAGSFLTVNPFFLHECFGGLKQTTAHGISIQAGFFHTEKAPPITGGTVRRTNRVPGAAFWTSFRRVLSKMGDPP